MGLPVASITQQQAAFAAAYNLAHGKDPTLLARANAIPLPPIPAGGVLIDTQMIWAKPNIQLFNAMKAGARYYFIKPAGYTTYKPGTGAAIYTPYGRSYTPLVANYVFGLNPPDQAYPTFLATFQAHFEATNVNNGLFAFMDNYVCPLVTAILVVGISGDIYDAFTAAPAVMATGSGAAGGTVTSAATTTTSGAADLTVTGTTPGAYSSLVDQAVINPAAAGNLAASTTLDTTINSALNAALGTTGAAVTDATLAAQVTAYSNSAYAGASSGTSIMDQVQNQLTGQAKKAAMGALLGKTAPATPAAKPPAPNPAPDSTAPFDPVLLAFGLVAAKLAFF